MRVSPSHNFGMETLQAGAFRVYLQHALVSALAVEALVNQQKQQLGEGPVKVSALLVKYCRSAQTACTVYGLAIIDRAGSFVLYRLRYDYDCYN
jgi:hypothetical protein